MNPGDLYHQHGVREQVCTRSKPDISGLKTIGIDEFAVKKGHVYKAIVVDFETGRIVYVCEGKGADALDGFWKMAGQGGVLASCQQTAVCK